MIDPLGYLGRRATTRRAGIIRIASNSEVLAGESDDTAITPKDAKDIVAPDATTTEAGVVIINDDGTLAGADDTTVPTALATKTYADALAIAGAPDASETVKGILQTSTDAESVTGTASTVAVVPSSLTARFEAPGAIGGTTPAASAFTTLSTTGLASLGASATIETGAVALSLGADAASGAINCGTGAAARVITIGNITGATQVVVNSGTAGISLASTGAGDITINSDDTLLLDSDGVLELNSSAGVINIGNDDIDQDINIGVDGERGVTIGSANGAASLDLVSGTGALNVGSNAIAHSVTIGNQIGATAVVIEVGTGDFILDGVTNSTFTVGASTTTGSITVGGTSQTGTITIGDSDGINTIELGSGEGATTVAIAGGATAAKTVNIATGAIGNLVTIGSKTAAAATTIQAGTVGLTLDASGIVDVVPATSTAAAATGTVNANVGVTTHTGLTTAAAASQVFTITNSVCTAGSAILVSASNLGANDAQMTVTRVTPGAGSFTVTLTNNGAAALNGDVILSWWIIAA